MLLCRNAARRGSTLKNMSPFTTRNLRARRRPRATSAKVEAPFLRFGLASKVSSVTSSITRRGIAHSTSADKNITRDIVPSATIAAVILAAVGVAAGYSGVLETSRFSFVGKKGNVWDFYELGDLLGEGGYGTVHMATPKASRQNLAQTQIDSLSSDADIGLRDDMASDERAASDTPSMVAVKKVDKQAMDQEEFMQEFSALKVIHDAGGHPNIAGMKEMFEDDRYFYLILELVSGGELFEHLIRNGAYSEQTAASMLRDLAGALDFLHSRGIIHADLKPENLMLSSWNDDDAKIKLVDFGCACGKGLNLEKTLAMSSRAGTPAYWPPELIRTEEAGKDYVFAPAADIWALGIIMFITLVGCHPFDLDGRATNEVLLDRIKHHGIPLRKKAMSHMSPSAVDLLKRLMEKDPRKRITAAEILQHPWTTGEKASGRIMKGVDERLASFQEVVRAKLETGLFAALVQQSVRNGKLATSGMGTGDDEVSGPSGNQSGVVEAVGVIKQAFSFFDKEGKGFVSAKDISRVLAESGEEHMSEEEASALNEAVANTHGAGKGVSMESFEKMISSLETVVFRRGDVIFSEGDDVETSPYMYILSSGKADVLKKLDEGGAPPAKLTSLTEGQIFGEAAMLKGGRRAATVRCATPVQAMRIGKDSLGRMLKESKSTSANLREMSILKEITRAKSLLRAVGNISQKRIPSGSVVIRQGDRGESMFSVVEGNLDVRVKRGDSDESHHPAGAKVATLHRGDMFGEIALMMKEPRNATVLCASTPVNIVNRDEEAGEAIIGPDQGCLLNEIKADDLMRMLNQSEHFKNSMKVILRTRMFRQAMLRLCSPESANAPIKEQLRTAFDIADVDQNGVLDTEELLGALRKAQSHLTQDDVKALMSLADLHQDGGISFNDFSRMMKWEEYE